jgi:type IV pilus assembly protein PilX
MAIHPHSHPESSQRGAALVIALILLLVMTLLGVAALRTTTLEERMAANSQERNRAFHAAESGLTQGLLSTLPGADLSSLIYSPPSSGSQMLDNDPTAGTATQSGATITAEFVDSGPVPVGSGTEANQGANIAAYYFNVTSTGGNNMTAGADGLASGTAAGNNAEAILNQGTWKPGAALNN